MSTNRRIKIVVAYDGYDFCGFAPQAGQRTVHGILTDGLRQVLGDDCEITGASRTDSGAHARGQVCHFDTGNPIPAERLPRAVNQVLPHDLTLLKGEEVHPDFHSRFWARKRWYRYRMLLGERDPMRTRYAFHYGKQLDVRAMQEAATGLVGTHDFIGFSQLFDSEKNSVRTLYSVEVKAFRDEVWVDVVGTAFVRGMMRRISGALWEIGRGAYPKSRITDLLAQRDKANIDWPTVLPACGLTLMKVSYGRHPSDIRDLDRDLETNR
ncbi:tRNA pseudouridine(38-40) synthase TruA [Kamptonema cortianum]|nr:tRNA pseudouridine(38-40) synthase TruA [Geitlerinema splendidum]MDK3162224.1 tRNA pseudouridine(38-40) synthase TruA [Kamptonema cortianum]